jgi:hypothetical protein
MRQIFAATLLGAMPATAATIGPVLPVAAKTTAAQQAISLYRDEYRHGYRACPTPTHANEVVICGNGRGGSANRIPLPDERTPPDWARQAVGDLPTGKETLVNTASGACVSADCPAQGAIDLIEAAAGMVQVVRALVDPESASDHADHQGSHPWAPKK